MGLSRYGTLVLSLIMSALIALFMSITPPTFTSAEWNSMLTDVDIGAHYQLFNLPNIAKGSFAHPAWQNTSVHSSEREQDMNSTFLNVVQKQAHEKGFVYLSLVDSGYKKMAYNFYETSLRPLGIRNYVFAGADKDICHELMQSNITCSFYTSDASAKESSSWGSTAFKRKTHIRTQFILEVLRAGVTLVHTDLDMVFMKDPEPYFTCIDCDLEIADDGKYVNNGFLKAKPTPAAITLFDKALQQATHQKRYCDQPILNSVIQEMNSSLKYKVLDKHQFASGGVFFSVGNRRRKGDNPCAECVTVHNNYIQSVEAKIYRFKEYGLWEVDRHEYYSNISSKYISFELLGHNVSIAEEVNSLQTSLVLGSILGRIVILPIFHAGTLLDILPKDKFMIVFDAKFNGRYRESSFLSHHRVPDKVKTSISPQYCIQSEYVSADASIGQIFTPRNVTLGPSPDELHSWFDQSQYSVLRLYSMDSEFSNLDLRELYRDIDSGFRCRR